MRERRFRSTVQLYRLKMKVIVICMVYILGIEGCSDTTIQRSRTNSLVEMCFRGQWLSACASDDIWTDDLAVIACEELQLPSVEARAIAAEGETSSTDTVIVIGECNRTEILGECVIGERTGGCRAPDVYIGVICSSLCEEALCNSSSCYPPLSTCHCPTLLRNATYPQDTQCQNGGTCNDDGQCMCPPGWSGNRCTTAISATCANIICLNGGTCLNPDHNCSCPANWTGPRCESTTLTKHIPLDVIFIAVGTVVVVFTAMLLIVTSVVGRYLRRKRRVRFLQADIRYARTTEELPPTSHIQAQPFSIREYEESLVTSNIYTTTQVHSSCNPWEPTSNNTTAFVHNNNNNTLEREIHQRETRQSERETVESEFYQSAHEMNIATEDETAGPDLESENTMGSSHDPQEDQ